MIVQKRFKRTSYKYYLLPFIFFFSTSSKIFAISAGEDQENYYEEFSEWEYERDEIDNLYKKAVVVIGTGAVVLLVVGIAYSYNGGFTHSIDQQKSPNKIQQDSNSEIMQHIKKNREEKQSTTNKNKISAAAATTDTIEEDTAPLAQDWRDFFNEKRIAKIEQFFKDEKEKNKINLIAEYLLKELKVEKISLMSGIDSPDTFWINTLENSFLKSKQIENSYSDEYFMVTLMAIVDILNDPNSKYSNKEKQQVLDFIDDLDHKFGISHILYPTLELNPVSCGKVEITNQNLLSRASKCCLLINKILLLGDVAISKEELEEFSELFNSKRVNDAGIRFKLVYKNEAGKENFIREIKIQEIASVD